MNDEKNNQVLNSEVSCDTFQRKRNEMKRRGRRRTDLEKICDQCLPFLRWTDQTDEDEVETATDLEEFDALEKANSTQQSHQSAGSKRAESETEYSKAVRGHTDTSRVFHSNIMRANCPEKTNVKIIRWRRESISPKFIYPLVGLVFLFPVIIDWNRDVLLVGHLRPRRRNRNHRRDEQSLHNGTRNHIPPSSLSIRSAAEEDEDAKVKRSESVVSTRQMRTHRSILISEKLK
jgi:hypothetical protein